MLIRGAIRNGITHILRNRLVSFLSLGVIAFALLIFGVFAFINQQIDGYINRYSENIEAIFYLHDTAQPTEIQQLADRLKGSVLVKEVLFISRDQAMRDFSQQYPDMKYILAEFDQSPFPASIQVTFLPIQAASRNQITSLINDIVALGIVESKQVNLEWAEKLSAVNRFINAVGWFLSTILIFIAVFIIFNTIKINIIYRKDEIVLFRLIGASDAYIRIPFIIEGAIMGFLGSLLACLMMVVLFRLFPWAADLIFDAVKNMIDLDKIPLDLFARMIALGTAIGLISSYLSLRRFLKN
jgi:cell division transport system permease protein